MHPLRIFAHRVVELRTIIALPQTHILMFFPLNAFLIAVHVCSDVTEAISRGETSLENGVQ